jgi:hypothetical protein
MEVRRRAEEIFPSIVNELTQRKEVIKCKRFCG